MHWLATEVAGRRGAPSIGYGKNAWRSVIRFMHLLTTRVAGRKSLLGIDYSRSGWRAMRNAEEIRNRLTHPKSPEACDVTDAEIATVAAALLWFDDALGRIQRVVQEVH